MDNELKKSEMDEAMKVLADYAKACYDEGCRDTIIGVAIGAGLALAGYIAVNILEEHKARKSKKELKKSIDEFCEFVDEKES